MKSIQKLRLAVIIIFIFTFLTGCSKKNITVTNDPELEQSLYGTWIFTTISQNEIMSDPNTESEKYLGNISVVNTNLIQLLYHFQYFYHISIYHLAKIYNLQLDIP